MHKFYYFQRITQRNEFEKIFAKSSRIYGNFFVCRIIPSHQSFSKLGIMVSKKFGNAVYRNRIRRLIKESFRHSKFPIPVSILLNQQKPFPNEILAKKELHKIFKLLNDKYFVRQLLVGENVSAKISQYSHRRLSFFAKMAFMLVFLYRKLFSSSLKPSCRFTPSCSVYSMEAFRVHGFFYGFFLTLKRLSMCRPGGSSGFDPVPFRKKKY